MQHFRKAPQKVVEKADPQIWVKKQEDILRRKLIDRQNALEKNLRAVEKQNMAAMQQRQRQFEEQQKKHQLLQTQIKEEDKKLFTDHTREYLERSEQIRNKIFANRKKELQRRC